VGRTTFIAIRTADIKHKIEAVDAWHDFLGVLLREDHTAECCTIQLSLGTKIEVMLAVFLLYSSVQLHRNRDSLCGYKN
jgi:hypothetical protein